MASPAATEHARDEPPERASVSHAVFASPRRARWRRWLWVAAILVAARVGLGLALAPVAETVLSRVLGTRVDVADVGFAPIDAVVTLRGVAVGPANGDAPPVTAARVRIDVQWLPLLHRALVVRELTLESARIDVARIRAAGWTLERVRRLDPSTELPRGWSFALERVALRDARIHAPDDFGAGDVTVRSARVSTRRLRPSAFGHAPNLRLDAVVDGGRLVVTGSSDLRDDGVAIDARVDVKDVPLDRLAARGPGLTEASVAGSMSARLRYERDPGRRDRLTGRLRGRRIAVHVPAMAEPALTIRRADAAVDRIDLLRRRVAIGALTLYGARVAVRPDLRAPVPLLDALAPAEASGAASPPPATPPWTWTIDHLASPFGRLQVAGADETESLAAEVAGENVGPGAYWSPLRAWIAWDGGAAAFDGTARMTRGFTLEGRVTAHDVDVSAVARAVGSPLATRVQAGRAAADLTVELALGDVDEAPRDLRGRVERNAPPFDVRGKVSVGDLWLAGPDPDALAVGARAVDLDVTGVASTGDGGGSKPVEIEVGSATVESPYVQLTRTAETSSPNAAPLAAAAEAPSAPPAVTLTVASVSAHYGRLVILDEAATPALALDVVPMDAWARQVRLPAGGVDEFVLQGAEHRLGAVRLAGARDGGALRAELSLPAVSLVALAPYLQRARLPWGFTAGTGAVRSRVALGGDRWTADTTLTLLDPVVGGDQAPLERSLGMSTAAAFAALRERDGEIALRLPLASPGFADGGALDDAVAAAVREALARPPIAAPIAVPFAAGRAQPGADAARDLAAIAEVLSARPDVVVELRGAISPVDRRWLAEQAVAAQETDEARGIRGWLRAIGLRDQHARIRDALAARAAGDAGRLDLDDERALRALVAARPPIAADRLATLAAARAALVATALADRYGAHAPRVVVAEPTPEAAAAAPVVEARFLPAPEAPW